MQRTLALDDRAVRVLLALAGVLLDDAHALHEHLGLLRKDGQDFAGGTLVVAADHLDGVALLHVKIETVGHDQRTSGASEMIFMKFFSRSSRATGPKMRVPFGLLSLSMMTIALLSKRR